jgi:hypothetical protein
MHLRDVKLCGANNKVKLVGRALLPPPAAVDLDSAAALP